MDIIKKLRAWHSPGETITGDVQLYLDAADEIERLRELLRDVYDVANSGEKIGDGLLDRIRQQMARGGE